ncbi:protein containg methyltransferase domain [Longilinea arvoryzae]|uniref:Protein containg methyltransferase domain n=1 Tax=Longilinea arvoryzae TaxID=360412 RepID=A0A0S7BHY1_9CHLR|nr:class I SAM-dependent methyltransferase [Longilinea arvoryzae]GAP14692.1 protein containg methyltransferase domain [Longilinea arvoryzae]
MSKDDSRRWNARYRDQFYDVEPLPRPILESALPYLKPDGLALDLAMGLGVNARWLVERGFRVLGVDVSSEAIIYAKKRCPQLMAVLADLDDLFLPSRSFSTILNFYFLKRDLILDFTRMIQPGGIAIVETLTIDMLTLNPEVPAEFLLQKGELPGLFKNWKILLYQEGWRPANHGGQKSVASLIAQFPN